MNTHVIKYTHLSNVQLMGQNSQNYLLLLGTEQLSKHFNYCSIILKTKIAVSLSQSLSFSLKNRKTMLELNTPVCRREIVGKKNPHAELWEGCDGKNSCSRRAINNSTK